MLVGQQIGPFEVERELGSGAMGTVYQARFTKGDSVVPIALKMVALGLLGNEGAMARFDREATILKQLRHPHIVRLIATGAWRKTPFIAMEYIDGEALDRVLARRAKLSWEEVVTYGKQLCEALQHAHDRGIIHRDLKPSNLMITRDGALKLTDFGIAKDTDVTALTGANSTIGTAAYMSPEQCKGDRNLTNKSDLYSLGIVFFELLSGRKPFTAETTVDMFLKHVNEKPPRIGKIVQDLPPKLEAIVLQLLEKEKDERPVDASWVARMLLEVEEDAFARKSAGLDAASARRADRGRGNPAAGPIDAADREAARALKGVKKKKKKKAAEAPWYEKKWARAAGILALLAAMGVGVFFALRPPSAEKLAAAIDAAKSPADKLAAAETYLDRYGTTPGEMTDKAAEVYRKGKVRERESQLERRFGNPKMRDEPEGDDPEAYHWAMQAIQAEKDGRSADALNLWDKIRVKFQEDGKVPFTVDPDRLARARLAWIAEERIADVRAARAAAEKIDATIAANRSYEKPTPFDPSSPEALATKARRLEQFKDADKARRLWETLAELTEKNPDQREWYLLACEHRGGGKDTPEAGLAKRVELVRAEVDAAAKRLQEIRKDGAERREWIALRGRCREVVELYEDETDKAVAEAVGRAKVLLEQAKDPA